MIEAVAELASGPRVSFVSQGDRRGPAMVPTRIEYSGVGHTPRWEIPDRFTADVSVFVRAAT